MVRNSIPSYAAFVLSPGDPIARVELGAAEPVDARVAQWREDIAHQNPRSAAAQQLRQLWEALESHFPRDVERVWIAPDGALAAVPWVALPDRGGESVLLERYLITTVPYGQWLVDALSSTADETRTTAKVLVGRRRRLREHIGRRQREWYAPSRGLRARTANNAALAAQRIDEAN